MSNMCSCRRKFKSMGGLRDHLRETGHEQPRWMRRDKPERPGTCDICSGSPVVIETGLCRRCTYGSQPEQKAMP